jgi:hypothetical protein
MNYVLSFFMFSLSSAGSACGCANFAECGEECRVRTVVLGPMIVDVG